MVQSSIIFCPAGNLDEFQRRGAILFDDFGDRVKAFFGRYWTIHAAGQGDRDTAYPVLVYRLHQVIKKLPDPFELADGVLVKIIDDPFPSSFTLYNHAWNQGLLINQGGHDANWMIRWSSYRVICPEDLPGVFLNKGDLSVRCRAGFPDQTQFQVSKLYATDIVNTQTGFCFFIFHAEILDEFL
jgi:hypothetical protein